MFSMKQMDEMDNDEASGDEVEGEGENKCHCEIETNTLDESIENEAEMAQRADNLEEYMSDVLDEGTVDKITAVADLGEHEVRTLQDGIEALDEEVKEAGRKKRICKFWQEEKCSKGDSCNFAHGDEELGKPIPAPAMSSREDPPGSETDHARDGPRRSRHAIEEVEEAQTTADARPVEKSEEKPVEKRRKSGNQRNK